jgi:hypothetical protein
MYRPDMWKPIASAPFDRDLELAVLDKDGPHPLIFPCQRIVDGWVNATTKQRTDVHPTHWREWPRQDPTSASPVETLGEDASDHAPSKLE